MNKGKRKILLIIGPTAVGKSSLIDRALKDHPELVDIITYTTRPMRSGESEGQPYHFVDEAKFKALVEKNFFVEWAEVHGRLYGTPRDQIETSHSTGRIAIADIDVQGAATIVRQYPEAVTVFLMPPSIDALSQRFVKRGVTSEEDLKKRLESAQREMARAHEFKHVLINDDFESTYATLTKIIEKWLKNQ